MRCGVRCEPGSERAVGAVVVQAACTRRTRLEVRGEGSTHRKHAAHACDARRVEAQRLVERRRVLPSRKEGIRSGVRCQPGGERAVGAVVVQAACTRRARLEVRGEGSTHHKHAAHACDARRVEAQRLVERRRVLPSRKEGIRSGVRCQPGGERAVGAVVVQAACTRRARLEVRGEGSTHHKHAAHACDARRVEAQRLVERRRVLPSRKEGMRCGTRCGPGGERAWVVAVTQAAYTGRAQLKYN